MTKQEIVQEHIGLVFFVVNPILRKRPSLNRVREDLVQEGTLGLMKGVSMYKPELGFKLSTYVIWWIKRFVFNAIRNLGPVSLNHGPTSKQRYPSGVPVVSEYEFEALTAKPWVDDLIAKVDAEKFAEHLRQELIRLRREMYARPSRRLDIDAAERDTEIYLRYRFDQDTSMHNLGREYGIARQRVDQIVVQMDVLFEHLRKEFLAGQHPFKPEDGAELYQPGRFHRAPGKTRVMRARIAKYFAKSKAIGRVKTFADMTPEERQEMHTLYEKRG